MSIHDIYEILRPTKSDVKSNKPKKREYGFDDGKKHPTTKKEYEDGKDEKDER